MPIERNYTVADLAAEFALPVVIVVKNRLGALNHTVLTVEHLRSHGLTCAGIILNDGQPTAEDANEPQTIAKATNRSMLEDLLGTPILFTVEPEGNLL